MLTIFFQLFHDFFGKQNPSSPQSSVYGMGGRFMLQCISDKILILQKNSVFTSTDVIAANLKYLASSTWK